MSPNQEKPIRLFMRRMGFFFPLVRCGIGPASVPDALLDSY